MSWLDESEQRCAAATEGPWTALHRATSRRIFNASPGTPDWGVERENRCLVTKYGEDSDLDFIASARTDLPHALRLLREAEDLFANPSPSELYPAKVQAWRARLQEGPR